MLKVSEYRQHAAECRRMASKAFEPEQRQQFEQMAEAWELLASEREKFLAKAQRYQFPPGKGSS